MDPLRNLGVVQMEIPVPRECGLRVTVRHDDPGSSSRESRLERGNSHENACSSKAG